MPQFNPGAPLGTIVVASAPLSFGVTLSRDNVMEIPWAAASCRTALSRAATSC